MISSWLLVGVRLDVIQVVTSKCIMGFQATGCHYNNVYGRCITTQYLRQIKENSKLNNSGFNKWLEILAGKELQTKLRKTENVDFKFRASNGTAKANPVN